MKKIILIASLLMAGGLYAEQLICEKFDGKKIIYTIVFPNKDVEEGLGFTSSKVDAYRFFYKRSVIGKEENGTPFLYQYDIIFDDGGVMTFYFNPFKMIGSYQPEGFKNLKCRYSE